MVFQTLYIKYKKIYGRRKNSTDRHKSGTE